MRSRAWGRAGGRDGRVGHSRTGGAGGGGGILYMCGRPGPDSILVTIYGHPPPPPSLLADCSCSLFCL